MWMAGGGTKGGLTYGAPTSSAGTQWKTVCMCTTSTPPSSTSWALTTTQLTYRYAGRDYRLTDVYGNVVHDLIA
jgi:hypothetical protein